MNAATKPIRKKPRTTKAASHGLECTFCSKHQREVKTLIAGPAVYICEECVALCVEIIREGDPLFGSLGLDEQRKVLDEERHARNLVRAKLADELAEVYEERARHIREDAARLRSERHGLPMPIARPGVST